MVQPQDHDSIIASMPTPTTVVTFHSGREIKKNTQYTLSGESFNRNHEVLNTMPLNYDEEL